MAVDFREATAKLAAAKTAKPEDAARLQKEAQVSLATAAKHERAFMAPVLGKAHGNAAYGLGVQYAVHEALKAETSGKSDAFDAAYKKADENSRGAEPPVLRIGG
jgi:hypothetical protein